ncbi:putative NADH dehydrogenase (ubiquinone) 29/21K chain precursor [Fusarium fujikuroi]|nr:putative NADH dehydrogenase (ubiquinone) 29/21K chain precursor [Fusarium fujikuroi]
MSSQAAKAASNVVSIAKKQTLQSTGIWEAFRRFLAIDPERSNGFAQLLTVGSAAAPKVELIGEAGEKQLVAVKQESETGLAKALEKATDATKDVFVNGMPPLPSGQTLATGKWDVHKYEVTETSYGEGYPCRSFK